MPPVIYEKALSRSLDISTNSESLPREFVILGTNDETEVLDLVLLASGVLWRGLVRSGIKADPQGGGVWFSTVTYSSTIDQQQAAGVEPQPPQGPGGGVPGGDTPLPRSVSWTTQGGQARITQSKGTRSATTATGVGNAIGNAGNNYTLANKRAIGLTNQSVEGCDVQVPAFNWSITVPRATCTTRYMARVMALTGTVNYGAPFYGFAAGEVLYTGANAQCSGQEAWSVTHSFSVQRNQVNLRISDSIVVPEKKGWDYVWVAYKLGQEPILSGLINVPESAWVEYVYDNGDFEDLEIGS